MGGLIGRVVGGVVDGIFDGVVVHIAGDTVVGGIGGPS